MNIQEAKEQIKKAVKIYLKKDEFGNYCIPIEKQRPVFLLGAPGIGKTAIVEQIANELEIGLVSYSMTHHTRQSALGLPFIKHTTYGGKEFDISEYTMSEIIASVYETMELSGKKEGILFLDEINCVSETLSPSMLQFLQYKTFGRHSVPDGWIVVTAGNPQEFNRSVREFDVVTLDRLKVLSCEPVYECWKSYAENRNVHKAILTYLNIKNADFYLIENTVDGRSYVTARGWEDLSNAIRLYEEEGFDVDQVLIEQYLRNKKIARDFAAYYDLYRKYEQDYKVDEILSGNADRAIRKRAAAAAFDERLSLMSLMLDSVQSDIAENVKTEDALRNLLPVLKDIKAEFTGKITGDTDVITSTLYKHNEVVQTEMDELLAARALSAEKKYLGQYTQSFLNYVSHMIKRQSVTSYDEAFSIIKAEYESRVARMKNGIMTIKAKLSNIFDFTVDVFGQENELLVLVTELTVNYASAKFISRNGCEEYYKYNKQFLLHERNNELLKQIEKLELDRAAENDDMEL